MNRKFIIPQRDTSAIADSRERIVEDTGEIDRDCVVVYPGHTDVEGLRALAKKGREDHKPGAQRFSFLDKLKDSIRVGVLGVRKGVRSVKYEGKD